MTTADTGQDGQPTGETGQQLPEGPPQTGITAVDEAMASVADLADVPVGEHRERLETAQSALHETLHSSPPG